MPQPDWFSQNAPQQAGQSSDWFASTAPNAVQQPGFFEALGHTFGIGKDEAQAKAQDLAQHPVRNLLEAAGGPAVQAVQGLYQGGKRILGELGQAGSAAMQGNAGAAASHAISAIPLVGPALDTAATQAQANGMNAPGNSYLKDLGIAATTPGTLGTVTGTAAQVAPTVLGAIDAAAPGRATIPTPNPAAAAFAQTKAIAGKYLPSLVDGPPESLMTRAVKPGKNNVGWNADVQTAIPLMKSAEQQIGRPIAGVDDALEAAATAKKGIWQQYQARLGPAAQMGAQIDGNQIADAMVNSIDKRTALQNPGLVDKVNAVADTYRRPMTVSDAEDFLQSTNTDLNTYYAKNKVSRLVAASDPETAYKVAEGDALRDALYSKLDQVSGPGAAQLKQAYGSLSNMQKELYGRQLVAARQNPESLQQQISTVRGVGKIAKGVFTMSPGDIVEGADNVVTSRAIAARNSTDAMITRAFQAAQPAQPFPMPTAPPRIAGMLPQQAGGPHVLEYYPEMSEGERVAALMQYLRNNRPQAALPARASAIPLPAGSPEESTAAKLWEWSTRK